MTICRRAMLLALLFAIIPAASRAQAYPTKPVRLVSPFPPGSSADVTSRLFAPKLADALGQTFVVDNRAGASGNIGAETVARAAPDGYTLLAATVPLAASKSLYTKLGFDLVRDFAPVAMLTTSAYLLVVKPALPVKTVKELIALAKAEPGKLNYASVGTGSPAHLIMELFKMQAGVDLIHVPYKGSSLVIPDLIGGQIDMFIATTLALLPQVKAGRLRALGISGARRSPATPDLPTISESGLPGFEATSWTVLLAPAGTPRAVVTRLNAAIAAISQTPEIIDRVASQGSALLTGTPEQTGAFVASEVAKWGKVVAAAGIRAE